MANPFLQGWYQAEESQRRGNLAGMQQAEGATRLRGLLEQQQEAEAFKGLLAQSGGDPEKAFAIALKSGNLGAAAKLEPTVKRIEQQKERQQTVEGLRSIYGGGAGAEPQQLGEGQPVAVAGDAGAAANPKEARIGQLKQMSLLYANNPVVMQRLQAEMDKLSAETRPMIEHNFSIGDNQVQPHISHDMGKTWAPIPGSKPSAKFAKQVTNVSMGGGEQPAPITEDTLRMDAFRYLTDGTLPPNMGRGIQGSAQATKIRNEASRLAKEELGMPVDEVRMAQLTNKAQVAAIAQLGRARAQILQSEKLANYNSDLALKASNEHARSGVPLLNRGVQWAQENLQGDPKLRDFTIANETFISEYAKVMSGGYGAAAPTEGAQARAHSILNRAATQEEYAKGVKQLKLEMDNRVKSLNSQMDEERGRLRGGIGKPPAAPTPAPAAPAAARDFRSEADKILGL